MREAEDIVARLISITKKFEDLLTKKTEKVKIIEVVMKFCDICELHGHATRKYPKLLAFKEVLNEQAKTVNIVPYQQITHIHKHITHIQNKPPTVPPQQHI